MKVTIQGNPKDYPVMEFVLQKDQANPTAITLFYCFTCGRSLFQYTGKAFRLIDEGTPAEFMEGQPQIIVYCHLCKRRYLINNLF